jgi:hypothetical protein
MADASGSDFRGAMLSPFADGSVWLDQRGAEIVNALFSVWEKHTRQCRNEATRAPADVLRVREVVRLAAKPLTSESADAGCADETKPQVIKVVMRSSAPGSTRPVLSCEDVADLAGVSAQSVRKACSSGRVSAERLGRSWAIDEASARRYAADCRVRRDRRGAGQGEAAG